MIIDWISYLLKVMACQACFLLFYRILLSSAGRHQWSRYYLLITLILSFSIPALQLQVYSRQPLPLSILEAEVVEPMEYVLTEAVRESRSSGGILLYRKLVPFLAGGYLLIAALLSIRFLVNLKVILNQIKQLPYDKLQGIKIYQTNELAPFSFFRAVFVPRELKTKTGFHQIVEHELAHARHWHSLDRLLTDFIIAFLWFNPFIYWYRNALKAVHEYQADESVLKRFPDKIAYQETLYRQLYVPAWKMASHFNTSIIKKRIVMMNQKRNTVHRALPYLTVPVVLLFSLAFSLKEINQPVNKVIREHIKLGPGAATLPLISLPQGTEKPEILPVDKAKLRRMSSAFGMRKDPRSGKRQHHAGIDFTAPIGTEVYATADGVVLTAENRPKGYGTIVELSHGEEGQYMTRYAHLDSFVVEKGQQVRKGEVIAYVGNSGWSLGPHLHYEVRLNGKAVDPEDYITDHNF